MAEFDTTLVREKIIFLDNEHEVLESETAPTVIRSNRVFLKLGERAAVEKLVVRGQNMQCTLRFAARIMNAYYKGARDFHEKKPSFNWQEIWEQSITSYDKEYNDKNWASIHVNGQAVFKTKASPFVDIIEKCALLSTDNYDKTMSVTEQVLKEVGKDMKIEHTSNVAAIFRDDGKHMKCSVVHRDGRADSTFSFVAANGEYDKRVVNTLMTCSAFIEAFHLRFFILGVREGMQRGKTNLETPEIRQMHAAIRRQSTLHKTVRSFENMFYVTYRPDRPNFFVD